MPGLAGTIEETAGVAPKGRKQRHVEELTIESLAKMA
jgi:hypothetical protein